MADTTPAEKARILVVDDELSIVEVLKALLRREGYSVMTASDGTEALTLLKQQPFDLMISDIRMRPMDGIALLQQARALLPHMGVIMITAYATVETAVEAMKYGAFDYICKPFKIDELTITVQRALSYELALAENETLRETFRATKYHYSMVGDSEKMQRLYGMIEKVARVESTVLVLGETGSGKKVVARALHAASRRADKPFLTVNCAQVPESLLESELFGLAEGVFPGAALKKEGILEMANGGTVFIDEIGSMPLGLQAKLLRLLLEREIIPAGGHQGFPADVRVIAAASERLENLIRLGQFREDLYHRLNMIPIEVPPLRERAADIPLLVNHFLGQINEKENRGLTLEKQALRALRQYEWPGNVAEMENVLRKAAAACETSMISLANLPPEVQAAAAEGAGNGPAAEIAQLRGQSLKAFLRAKEKDYIRFVLNQCGGNKERAAAALGISLATFYRKYGDTDA